MIRLIAFACCLLTPRAFAAPYGTACSAMVDMPEAQEFAALTALPAGRELAANRRAAALLAANQAALEAFRETAKLGSDGNFLMQKPEKPETVSPAPAFGEIEKLLNLVLLDARMHTARKLPRAAERDLLAVAGLLVQLAQQKYAMLPASLTLQSFMQKAYPLLAQSAGKKALPSTAYLAELSGQLARIAREQDFLAAAILEETEIKKNAARERANMRNSDQERKKLALGKSLVALAVQDLEFFSGVYERFDAAADAEARAAGAAVRENSPKIEEDFLAQRDKQIAERKSARDKRGWLDTLRDGATGAAETKKLLAEETADALTGTAAGPGWTKLAEPYHVFFNQLNALHTGVALKLRLRERGKLPEDLKSLVPAYLSEVPADSFNKFQPLRYLKKGGGFRVYSLGPDQKDEEGLAAFDWAKYSADPAARAGDIVFAE
ncbi:MAG TPA: hypothetical protein PKI19_12345 [Elusimicrobiales bacterium]|nr:hypothetical protein [Elusimicrobiales bacterium]